MRPDDLPAIRQLALFADMAQARFDHMMQASYLQIFPPQVQLISEGDPPDFLHVVVEGCVELYARGSARETTMELVFPVTTFILAAVIRDAAYLMSGRTTEKSKILLIPARDVRTAFVEDVAFARAIVSDLATSYRTVVKEFKNHKLRNAVERLANRLLRLHADQGATGRLELPYDKRTLASLLGMTPENLSRAFGTLRPYGVEVSGAEIKLNRIADLEGLARPNPLIDDLQR